MPRRPGNTLRSPTSPCRTGTVPACLSCIETTVLRQSVLELAVVGVVGSPPLILIFRDEIAGPGGYAAADARVTIEEPAGTPLNATRWRAEARTPSRRRQVPRSAKTRAAGAAHGARVLQIGRVPGRALGDLHRRRAGTLAGR